jgi:DNA repair exonuclease SbcCD ATPase subunit
LAQKKKAQDTDDGVGGGGNINQIRDILVGPFQREQEARLEQLERKVERHHKETTTAAKRAQDKVEKQLDANAEKLRGKIAELSDTLQDATKSSAAARAALGAEARESREELRTRLQSDVQGLEKLTQDYVTALRGDLDATTAQLREEKVGRQDLGDYLMELGMRLKGESSLKAIESSVKGGKRGVKKS